MIGFQIEYPVNTAISVDQHYNLIAFTRRQLFGWRAESDYVIFPNWAHVQFELLPGLAARTLQQPHAAITFFRFDDFAALIAAVQQSWFARGEFTCVDSQNRAFWSSFNATSQHVRRCPCMFRSQRNEVYHTTLPGLYCFSPTTRTLGKLVFHRCVLTPISWTNLM
jgi:hypothetical protein